MPGTAASRYQINLVNILFFLYSLLNCGRRITALPELPKLVTRVRLPSVAEKKFINTLNIISFNLTCLKSIKRESKRSRGLEDTRVSER